VRGCPPPGKAGYGEIEAPPKEVDGAAFPDETGTEDFQDPVRLDERLEKTLGRIALVDAVGAILRKGCGVAQLVRMADEFRVDPVVFEERAELGVKVRDRAIFETKGLACSGAREKNQFMRQKIEVEGEN